MAEWPLPVQVLAAAGLVGGSLTIVYLVLHLPSLSASGVTLLLLVWAGLAWASLYFSQQQRLLRLEQKRALGKV